MTSATVLRIPGLHPSIKGKNTSADRLADGLPRNAIRSPHLEVHWNCREFESSDATIAPEQRGSGQHCPSDKSR